MPRARKPKTTRDEWGSVTPARNGQWRLRYQGPDGKRREGGYYPTKAEAEDARARLRTSILGGTWHAPSPGDSPTLTEFVAAFLQRAEMNEDLAPRAVQLYRGQLARLVLPELGGIELGQVPVGKLTRETVMARDLAARAFFACPCCPAGTNDDGAAARRRRGHPARAGLVRSTSVTSQYA